MSYKHRDRRYKVFLFCFRLISCLYVLMSCMRQCKFHLLPFARDAFLLCGKYTVRQNLTNHPYYPPTSPQQQVYLHRQTVFLLGDVVGMQRNHHYYHLRHSSSRIGGLVLSLFPIAIAVLFGSFLLIIVCTIDSSRVVVLAVDATPIIYTNVIFFHVGLKYGIQYFMIDFFPD